MHRLEVLAPEERHTLLEEFNPTARGLPEATLPALFEAQVVRTPEAFALVCGEERLSYGALNARANRLAHLLIAQGVGPERVVGIALERSPEMVVALLAILKAGGAYCRWIPSIPRRGWRRCWPTRPPSWCSPAASCARGCRGSLSARPRCRRDPGRAGPSAQRTTPQMRTAPPPSCPSTPPMSSTPPAPPGSPRAWWSSTPG